MISASRVSPAQLLSPLKGLINCPFQFKQEPPHEADDSMSEHTDDSTEVQMGSLSKTTEDSVTSAEVEACAASKAKTPKTADAGTMTDDIRELADQAFKLDLEHDDKYLARGTALAPQTNTPAKAEAVVKKMQVCSTHLYLRLLSRD